MILIKNICDKNDSNQFFLKCSINIKVKNLTF